jgi:hypothetical protein
MTNSVHKGGCACGKFRFEARGEAYRAGLCYCITCRKSHGAPFNYFVVFPAESVTISGEVTEFKSSDQGRRYSCRACGTPAYSLYHDDKGEIHLYGGSFDEPGLWQPEYELWRKRREPWLSEFECIVNRYEEERPQFRRTESD